MTARSARTAPTAFDLIEAMIDRFGETFDPALPPRDMRRVPRGRCFTNAHRLSNSEYFYVEGLAVPPDGSGEHSHAWLVDKLGRVADPTWGNGLFYRGIILSADYRYSICGRSRAVPEGGFLFWAAHGPDPESEIERARILLDTRA